MITYYSLLEQHNNGAWWYHHNTYKTRHEAEEYCDKWIWWDKERPKHILEHHIPLPDKLLITYDFKSFYDPYGAGDSPVIVLDDEEKAI